ncbi:MAG: tape measure protein [Burkholderiales bacterium]|jgi:tape measure domain-containing protein|nr:tape measure protein [Burkholderiales bacterium]
MAAQNVVIGIQLKADGSGFVGAINVGRDALKSLADDAKNTGEKLNSSFGATRRGLTSISEQLREARNYLIGFVSVAGIAHLAKGFLETADAITQVNSRMKFYTESATELAAVKDRLYNTAQHLGAGVQSLNEAFIRLQPSVQAMGGSTRNTIDIVEALTAAVKTSGASESDAAAAMAKFAQAMESGTMSGKELKSMLNTVPSLARALADGLGISVQELRKMADEGAISADKMVKALLSQSQKLQAEAASMGATFSDSIQRFKNTSMQATEALNNQYRITDILSTAASMLSEEIDRLNRSTDGSAVSMKDAWEAGRSLAIVFAGIAESVKFLKDTIFALKDAVVAIVADLSLLGQAIKFPFDVITKGMDDAKKRMDYYKKWARESAESSKKSFFNMAWQNQFRMTRGLMDTNNETSPKTNAPADANLSVDPAIIEKQWQAVTGAIKTTDSIEREYQKTLTASREKYGQLVKAMLDRGATEDQIAEVVKRAGDIESGLAKKRDQDIESLKRQGRVKLEVHDQYAKALLTTTERMAAAERTLEDADAQAQLASLDRLHGNQLISEEEYQRQKLEIKRVGFEKQRAMLQEAVGALDIAPKPVFRRFYRYPLSTPLFGKSTMLG